MVCDLWSIPHGGARLGNIFVSTFVLVREKKKKKKKQEEWAQKMFEEREQTPLLLRKMILGTQPRVFLSEW